MIPSDKVQNIINKYNSLEKELSSGEFDAKQFAKKSKEYSDLKNIIKIAKEYLNYDKNKKDLNNIINIIDKRKKNNNPLKGEIILIVDGYAEEDLNIEKLHIIIKNKLKKLSLRDAVNEIINETKLPRKLIYKEAVKIRNDECT